jgi:hypothetical protein
MSRGGRNAIEWLNMLDRYAMHEVMTVLDGRITDASDAAEHPGAPEQSRRSCAACVAARRPIPRTCPR